MDADLDTLAVALYVRIDDTLKDRPDLRQWRPKVGIAPKLSDANTCSPLGIGLVLAVMGLFDDLRGLSPFLHRPLIGPESSLHTELVSA